MATRIDDEPKSKRTIFWVKDEPYSTLREAVSEVKRRIKKYRGKRLCVFRQHMTITGDFTMMHRRTKVKCISKSSRKR